MRKVQSIGLMLAFSLLGTHSCTKTKAELKPNHAQGSHCQNDEDCLAIKADCCGCRQGGTQKAIAKATLEQELKAINKRCEGTMCIQAISTSPSCAQSPVCRSGTCR